MSYLIKDLSRLSKLSPARIRKWQERYTIFEPVRGENGYWYYTEQDKDVLLGMKTRLERGEKLKDIIALGRDGLLESTTEGEAENPDATQNLTMVQAS